MLAFHRMLRSQTSGYCVMQPLSRSSSSVSSCCSGLRENGTSEEEENDRVGVWSLTNRGYPPWFFTRCIIKTHLLCPLQELTCSLKGPPKQDSMVQSMWLDDSDCTPSTSSSPGKKERKIEKNPTYASRSVWEVEPNLLYAVLNILEAQVDDSPGKWGEQLPCKV